jgi:rhamnose utilization protein RhaD (predicted bifunctional aldolase and dehydrogenase)
VPLEMATLLQALNNDSPDCENCLPFVRQDMNALGLRPSIETSVHGLMPHPVVVHVHCVNTIAWAIREDAEAQLASRLKAFDWSFIPYARPGLQLARAIRKHLKPGSDVMILGNHGLAVAANSVAAAENLLQRVVKALDCPVSAVEDADIDALQAMCVGTDFILAKDKHVHAAALDERAFQLGCSKVYYPDHAVFLGDHIPKSIDAKAIAVAIAGKGVLVHQNAKPSIEPMLRCVGDVFLRLAPDAPLKALTATDIDQLLNWDAEKYRQTLQQP